MPGRHITDCRRRLFLSERQKTTTGVAAARSGFSRASACRMTGKTRGAAKPRKHRRSDALASVWEPEVFCCWSAVPGSVQ